MAPAESCEPTAVGEAVLLADARSQTRVQETTAEHVVGEQQGGIVWMIVLHLNDLGREQVGIALVWRLDVHCPGRHILVCHGNALVCLGRAQSANTCSSTGTISFGSKSPTMAMVPPSAP